MGQMSPKLVQLLQHRVVLHHALLSLPVGLLGAFHTAEDVTKEPFRRRRRRRRTHGITPRHQQHCT